MITFAGEMLVAWVPGLFLLSLFAGCLKLSAHLLGSWHISWKTSFLFAFLAFFAFAFGNSLPNPAHFIYQFTVCVILGVWLLGKRAKDGMENDLGPNRSAQLSAVAFAMWKAIGALSVLSSFNAISS